MANTIPPIVAFDYVKRMIKFMPLDQIMARLVNRVAYYMWMDAPWRWTLGSLPVVPLIANTQDYTAAFPSDFLYPVSCYIVRGSATAGDIAPGRELQIWPTMETARGVLGNPSMIAWIGTAGTNGTVRINPIPGQVNTIENVIGLYKKSMTPFTNSTVYTGTMPFDDEWFPVFEEGVLWQAYLFADDRKAGEASGIGEKMQFSGQRAVFESALQHMREREPLITVSPFGPTQKDTKK